MSRYFALEDEKKPAISASLSGHVKHCGSQQLATNVTLFYYLQ